MTAAEQPKTLHFPPLPAGPATATLRWPDRDVARNLWTTIDELTEEFGDRYSEARIIGVAIGALRDLRGSTRVEALPELICRLARVRLLDGGATGGRGAA